MSNPSSNVKDVVLLGCGRSVADLTPEEKERINKADVSIALNKFMAFYYTVGIKPTHVWFADLHEPSPRILQYIFDVCARDKLKDLTFILLGHAYHRYYTDKMAFTWARLRNKACWTLMDIGCRLYLAPSSSRLQLVRIGDWLTSEEWATDLTQPLFQDRTSFTTALNYISICFPGAKVQLVGCDFNSPGYFFQEEMEKLNLGWDDWTSKDQKEAGAHFAILPYKEHPPVTDTFPRIRQQLQVVNVNVYCHNKDSLVISEGLAEYGPI